MTTDSIERALHLGEGAPVEYRSQCIDAGEIGPTICAFLNTTGGYLVCGVDESGGLVGVPHDERLVERLERELLPGLSPPALISFQVQEVEGVLVLVIEVPAGKDVPYAFGDTVYIRDGHATRRADIATIRDMVLRAQVEPVRWERRFSTADLPQDLDLGEVRAVESAVQRTGRLVLDNDTTPISVLETLGAVRYGRLTNGGDVLFGINPASRYPQVRVRAVAFTENRTDDSYRDMKSFEGPLVPVLERVYAFILRNTPTRASFRSGVLERRDEPLYPENAVREGLVNAFAHRDYSDFSGGIAVQIYPDRLEIWNSGRFPPGVTPESLRSGQISVLRNPDIAHVLHLRGMMEKVGRGSAMIRDEAIRRGLPEPLWSEDERSVTLTFFAGDVTTEVAPEVTPEVTPEVGRLLAALDGDLTRRELQNRLNLRDSKNFREVYLQPALQAGVIEMTIPEAPRSSRQRYRLTEKGRTVRAEGRRAHE